jgi:hypothetical protein
MNYKCKYCNYESYDKFNYKKHLTTKKHKEKVNECLIESPLNPCRIQIESMVLKEHICQYCNRYYSTASNLSKHINNCKNKDLLIDEINRLKTQLAIKDEKINDLCNMSSQKDDMISVLKSEVAHLKSIVNNTSSIVKTSVSTMAYVIKNFKDAPALETMIDYSALHYEQNTNQFVEELIYHYEHSRLDEYIGNFIIKYYKKEDPNKQSIWNSDTSRLTYLIRELLNNKVDWKVDKKGIKTTKFIIEPILTYIDDQIREYIQTFDIDYTIINAREAEREMMKVKSATDILKSIEDKILCEMILKYITPYFYLNKVESI